MALSEQSLTFLTENMIMNSRDWFHEQKPRYKEFVEGPMLALSAQLATTMAQIDPHMTLEPRRTISRIWKDMRYAKGHSMFRDVMWLIFRRGKGMEYPAYFFEFSPRGFRYGVGYYSTPAAVMDKIRSWVLNDDKRFLSAQKALASLPGFQLEGDLYKRKRFPDAPADKQEWLERKQLVAIYNSTDLDALFSETLHETLAKAYVQLTPLYALFLDAHMEQLLQSQEGDRL